MRVCIPSLDPGGPDGVVAASFEEAEVFDFYDVHSDGNFERVAQTRPCTCTGPNQVEVVSRRGIDSVIVATLSPNALLSFKNSGIKVLRADNRSVTALLDSYAVGKLTEIGMNEFSRLGRNERKG